MATDKTSRMSCCSCCRNLAASPDSDEENKDERWAYWFAGVAMGPDTVNATWWTGVILMLAASDSTCGTNPGTVESVQSGMDHVGLSSGADGMACTPEENWNASAWNAFNGSSCLAKTGGIDTTYHNLPDPECQAAFKAYRAVYDYTCNCSLRDPYAFLGGTGGTRPSTVVTWSVVATCIVCAILLPALGNLVDASTKRRQVFFYGSILTGVWTLFGSILGSNYVWAVALVFTSLTAVTYEIAYLGLGPYLPEIATTDSARNKVSGLRQMGSTAAQLGFAVVTGVPSLFLAPLVMAILGNVVCCLWICLCAPLAYKALRDRPASGSRGNPYAELMKTLQEAKKYPHCFRFLLMHAFSGSAVGSVITQMQTFSAALGFSAFDILVLVVVILIFAPVAAAIYSFCLNTISPKKHQLFINVLFILFIIFFSLAFKPGSLVLGIIGAVIVGIGFGLFYSLNMANFMKVVPAAHKSEFVGLMGFFGFAFRFVPAAVYGAIVEATNSHEYAFMSIAIWNFLAFIICLTIDFEQGEKDALGESSVAMNSIPDAASTPEDEVVVEKIVAGEAQ